MMLKNFILKINAFQDRQSPIKLKELEWVQSMEHLQQNLILLVLSEELLFKPSLIAALLGNSYHFSVWFRRSILVFLLLCCGSSLFAYFIC